MLRGLGAPPAFPAGTALLSVAEEGAANTQIGSPLTATATVRDALFYRLVGAGAVFFKHRPGYTGQLSTKTRLDYENPMDADRDNTYELMVHARDGMPVAFRAVAVSVTNLDEAGTVAPRLDRPRGGQVLDGDPERPGRRGDQSDLDLGMVTHPHRHVHDDQQREQRDLHARSGGCGTVPEGVSVTYTDSLGSGKTAEMTSFIPGGGQPSAGVRPSPRSVRFLVDENVTTGTLGTVTATDPDNDAITYSVGVDDDLDGMVFNEDFHLDSTSGTITVKSDATIDYESWSTYVIAIMATDPFESTGLRHHRHHQRDQPR